ncbi:LysM peptidoglycan-binding domain-containing protein, partial [Pseudomonas viridiflava]
AGTTAAGAPAAYTVAPDDLIGDVAARFGITVRDLVWLNEGVQVFGQDQHLYEGTTLNLDPLGR